MTLDEAIKHEEETVEEIELLGKKYNYFENKNYQKFAEEHRQLAEWLKDYKRLLELIDKIKAEIGYK